jgi:hypothetical protein
MHLVVYPKEIILVQTAALSLLNVLNFAEPTYVDYGHHVYDVDREIELAVAVLVCL